MQFISIFLFYLCFFFLNNTITVFLPLSIFCRNLIYPGPLAKGGNDCLFGQLSSRMRTIWPLSPCTHTRTLLIYPYLCLFLSSSICLSFHCLLGISARMLPQCGCNRRPQFWGFTQRKYPRSRVIWPSPRSILPGITHQGTENHKVGYQGYFLKT